MISFSFLADLFVRPSPPAFWRLGMAGIWAVALTSAVHTTALATTPREVGLATPERVVFTTPERARLAPAAPVGLADLNQNKILDTLDARLAQARPSDSFDVIVTLEPPLDADSFPLVEAEMGAFGPTHVLSLVNAVAVRLTAAQIAAFARIDAVHQVEGDEWMVAQSTAAIKYLGVTGARADFGLTGDGDGDPAVFTKADNTIAIIDTGIDASHVDLSGGKVIGWKDFINDRPFPYDDSKRTVNGTRQPLGHGTHVASVAAGRESPGHGGVAPGAALVGVKVLNEDGAARLSQIADAIQWCVMNRDTYGIRILNLSLGSPVPSDGTDIVSRAVDAATAAGLVVICATGNSGPGGATVGAPAAARTAISVGAIADPDDGGVYLASFSSRGPTLDGRVKPDIVVPGVNIMGARVNTFDQYSVQSGTSVAAPLVSGFVALLLQAAPHLSVTDVYETVTRNARDFGPVGPDNDYGYGLLDGYAALRASRSPGSGAPALPSHLFGSGRITSFLRSATHTFDVASTQFPVAVTVLIGDLGSPFSPFLNGTGTLPDLDAELLDPDGKRVAASAGTDRQETLTFRPVKTGRYTLRVYGFRSRDQGGYSFDVSAMLSATDLTASRWGPPPGFPGF